MHAVAASDQDSTQNEWARQAYPLPLPPRPPSNLLKWDDQFEEHLDTLLGINGQGDFYWNVVVPEAVIYVHSALEGITLATAEKMVESMSKN